LPAVALNVAPFALFNSVTLASGTSAPLGSLTMPRREVDAVWADTRVAAEKIQSIVPQSSRLTAGSSKGLALRFTSDARYGLVRLRALHSSSSRAANHADRRQEYSSLLDVHFAGKIHPQKQLTGWNGPSGTKLFRGEAPGLLVFS
jgi:hypothetical protein